MKLMIGLGNTGKEYDGTRHNLGKRVIQHFADTHNARFKKHGSIAEIATTTIADDLIVCMQTTGFMNESGVPLREVASFYKIPAENCIVIYDDIDLPFGTIRVAQNNSSGGHNGVKSVIEHLDSAHFIRVRLGIGPKLGDAADYVLGRWSKEQSAALPEFVAEAVGALEMVLEMGLQQATTIYN